MSEKLIEEPFALIWTGMGPKNPKDILDDVLGEWANLDWRAHVYEPSQRLVILKFETHGATAVALVEAESSGAIVLHLQDIVGGDSGMVLLVEGDFKAVVTVMYGDNLRLKHTCTPKGVHEVCVGEDGHETQHAWVTLTRRQFKEIGIGCGQ